MGFGGVRASKFRHVYGQPAKKEHCYENVQITQNPLFRGICVVNPKFIAIVTETTGGGSFLVLPLEQYGRLDPQNTFKVTGHSGPILDIKWNPFNDNIIASASTDASVKIWYIPDGGLTANLTESHIKLTDHKGRVGIVEWHPTAENILATVGFDHKIVIWHVKTAEAAYRIDCHPDIIYSIAFNYDGSLLATTCKDKKFRIIDPRTGKILSEGECHTGAKASKVIFLGNTGRILTTGFARYSSERQFAIWAARNQSKPLACEIIDSLPGALFPFYDHDTRMLYLAGKGDGNIKYFEMVDHPPWTYYLNQFMSGSSQSGVGWMPKRGCDVYRCEIARFYKLHTAKGLCEPISMIVPRKSNQFQDDIFPDTLAPTPAMTAVEWISGGTRPPVFFSLKTQVNVKTHKPVNYRGNDLDNKLTDRNNQMKFEFLSQETALDYRTLDDNNSSLDRHGNQGGNSEDLKEFEYDEDDQDDHLNYNYSHNKVNTDMYPITAPHRSVSCRSHASIHRTFSSKMLNLIGVFQEQADKFDFARENENKEKLGSTWTKKAVEQRKVSGIGSQLQNFGSMPNLTLQPEVGKFAPSMGKIKDVENKQEHRTLDEIRSGYIKKCLEVEQLKLMIALKDKKINELESHMALLSNVHS